MSGKEGRSGTTGSKDNGSRGEHNRKKCTKQQKIVQRLEMVQLLRRGWTKAMIAEEFGVSRAQISHDWKIIVTDVYGSNSDDVKEMIQQKLEEIAEIKKEAWNAWEKSKKVHVRRTEESALRVPRVIDSKTHIEVPSGPAEMKKVKQTVIKEGSMGDSNYLRVVLDCIRKECELMQLNPAKELRLKGTMDVTNWDGIVIPPPGMPVPDDVEREIAKALGYADGPLPMPKMPYGDVIDGKATKTVSDPSSPEYGLKELEEQQQGE